MRRRPWVVLHVWYQLLHLPIGKCALATRRNKCCSDAPLLPRRMYPGRERVGEPRSRMSFEPAVDVLDGVDWWWGRSIFLAVRFLARKRPSTIVMQWWTATVLHTYLVLAVTGRLVGSRLVIELHEIQDSGEGRIPLARWYGRVGLGLLLRPCDACVVTLRPTARHSDNSIAGPAPSRRSAARSL